MTFGEKLQDLRKKAGMSQDTLAEKLEVSRQAVSKWERDEAMPETEKVIRIARLFGVSMDTLFMEEPKEPPQPQQQKAPSGFGRSLRRNAYKGGYVLVALGVLVSLVCVVIRFVYVNMTTSTVDTFLGMADSMYSGFPGMNTMLPQVGSATQAMEETAIGWANQFLWGLVPGVILIVSGIVVVIKGKKPRRK